MNNPIQLFEKIRDNFILYLETAFGTRYLDFEEERNSLMKRDKVFARAPWVEPLPTYMPSEFTIDDITTISSLDNNELNIFKSIVRAGLFGENKLYEHQWQMLTQAMEGNHCVITSGTGSGKTESFLLPLFAYLSKEINSWKDKPNVVNVFQWWAPNKQFTINDNGTMTDRVKQRPQINRPAAVRALIVYPMNALVEDQLSRLRKALDSDDARQVFHEYNNNLIYFGRYTGTSPVSGKLLKDDGTRNNFTISRLRKAMGAIQANIDEVTNYINENPDNKTEQELKDLLANFQRLDGAEMRTRFDMQETPPDILITNFSMLSIMLMRTNDIPLLEKTKDWLSCTTEFDADLKPEEIEKEKKNRIFHIIIDELHLYRGGSGTETAFLIRMLLERLGLSPDSDQLRILASSASLEGDDGRLFLKSFFGTETKEIRIIEGTQMEPIGVSNILLDVRLFEKVGLNSLRIERALNGIVYVEVDSHINDIIGVENANLLNYLIYNQDEITKKLFQAYRVEGRVRAVPAFKNGINDDTVGVISLAEILFGTNQSENHEAIKGFLFLLGIYERFQIETVFSRLRFHFFYRNIGGLWAELKSDSEMQGNPSSKPISNLMTIPLLISNNKRTLEILYCENCGSIAYGGSRIDIKDDNECTITELVPLSADVEGVPETSPATIVEKRKYIDFSVFYPDDVNGEIIQPEFRIPKNANDDFNAEWQVAWINVKSGRINLFNPNDTTNNKKGLWYRVKSNSTDIKELDQTEKILSIAALPCSCPHCKSDYSKFAPKKKKYSPFRGFRTGFGKVSQILSKELFEDLPHGKNKKKLVAFSDSREDAAKLAKNLEEEHYISLVREIMVHNITKELQIDNEILTAIVEENENEGDRLYNQFQERYEEIETIVNGARRGNQGRINELNALSDNVRHISTFRSIIIKNLLKLGVNPAGPFKSTQQVSTQIEPGRFRYVSWENAFDFEAYSYIDGYYYVYRNNGNQVVTKISEHFNTKIEQNLSGFIFGRLFYSFEASGLGYATIISDIQQWADELDISADKLKQVCNSFIRIWGDTYKHNRSDFNVTPYSEYSRIRNDRRERRYLKKVAENLNRNEVDLGNAVFSILENSQHRGLIEINNLRIKLVSRASTYFSCTTCGTIHLHASAGVCVFCQNNLNDQPEAECVQDLLKKSYLTFNLLKEYTPFRLHTEELSGQTDDQLTRQREFKDIFINQADKKTKAIELLSVTTTLEVGVDIGSLQAILLANMPPQRFNYQQRVGRTGRRGQLFSYALTIARGRSHDEFYFENPISITGDKPPQPFLSLGQEQVFKRVLAKSILQSAFRSFGFIKGSVHGEFGLIQEFRDTNQNLLSDYLNANINGRVKDIFDSLNRGIYVSENLTPYSFESIRQWILELPLTIISKIEASSNTNLDLSEFLAENGILPLQGMPTRVRNLIHGFKLLGDNEGYEASVMDRDLGVAIYDYAPGSQKTKDKGVVQSIGFTPDITGIKYNPINKQMEAETMQDDAFTFRVWMRQDNSTLQLQTFEYDTHNKDGKNGRPNDEEGFTIFLGATPAAFRTDLKYPQDSNEDFDINFSKPITFATSVDAIPKVVNNAAISYSEQDTTWKINNNGKKQFTGKYYNSNKYGADLPKQWLLNGLNSNNIPIANAEDEVLSIVSGKVTEVVRVEPQNFPLSIDVDPFSNDNLKASSSKGAFYSAAFLLQRTLAAKLDIDPEEIEIAAIESIELPEQEGVVGRRSARIVLSDELPNGSGFVKQLYDNFLYYLRRCVNPEKDIDEKYNFNILQNRDCKDASYQDLKNYRNMSFHPLLDWRLAVGLLRLMSDNTYKSGLTEIDYQKPELVDWKEFAEDLRDKFVISFSNTSATTFGELPGIIFMDNFKVIIVHPFWNYSSHQSEENILTDAIAAAGFENLYFIDTFNLHRRPSWCYSKLISMIQNNQ